MLYEVITMNMLGEYNIGGDAFELERLLDRCGIKLNATFSGNSSILDFDVITSYSIHYTKLYDHPVLLSCFW